MIEKEVKKIKILIVVCLALVAVGGANIALGISGEGWFPVFLAYFAVSFLPGALCGTLERSKDMQP